MPTVRRRVLGELLLKLSLIIKILLLYILLFKIIYLPSVRRRVLGELFMFCACKGNVLVYTRDGGAEGFY